jgi:hypothetical protein
MESGPSTISCRRTQKRNSWLELGTIAKAAPPDQFKRWLMTNIGGYDEVTYRPRGRSWFVLSGYRGDDIYYEKVVLLRWASGQRHGCHLPERRKGPLRSGGGADGR